MRSEMPFVVSVVSLFALIGGFGLARLLLASEGKAAAKVIAVAAMTLFFILWVLIDRYG